MNIKCLVQLSVSTIVATLLSNTNINSLVKAEVLSTNTSHYEYCYQYAQEKEYELAIKYCDQTIKLYPNFPDAYIVRGNIYRQQGKIKLALANYDRAIELDPNLPSAYFGRSIIYRSQRRLKLALSDGEKAIKLAPNNPHAYSVVGAINFQLGDLEKSEANLQEARRLLSAQGDSKRVKKVDGILKNLKRLKKINRVFTKLGYPNFVEKIIDVFNL